jgi:thioesterase domain-containing protein/acyl carrier protein
MDNGGALLPRGAIGEIVIQGPNVIAGYDNDPEVNAEAFRGGWFRTGDQGFVDTDGFIFITGRINELINRAGMKIAPREIDDVLLQHPAVAQAVTFALPDERLGQAVAAAVVVQPDSPVTENDLIAFVNERLADYKVPARILIRDDLPKGPTGKSLRVGLAEKLGLPGYALPTPEAGNVSPRPHNTVEDALVRIWQQVLGLSCVDVRDNFFQLGGDSLLATALLARIEQTFGRRLLRHELFRAQTVADLADLLAREPKEAGEHPAIIPIRTGDRRAPLLLVPPVGHAVAFHDLIDQLDVQQPLYMLVPPEAKMHQSHGDMTEAVTRYVSAWEKIHPQGPYYLCGYSSGGILAYELARQLEARGRAAALLVLIDTNCPGYARPPRLRQRLWAYRRALARRTPGQTVRHCLAAMGMVVSGRVGWLFQRGARAQPGLPAGRRYTPEAYRGQILLFRGDIPWQVDETQSDLGWESVAVGRLIVRQVPGDHVSILRNPGVSMMAAYLNEYLHTHNGIAANE